MKSNLHHLLAIVAAAVALNSCAPSNLSYQPRMSDAELAASQQRIERVEDRAFYERDRERDSEANAIEKATRHAPRSVTNVNNSTSFWVW